MSHSVQALILAAGKSTRFKTETSKLSFPLCGQEMILYPIKLLDLMHIPTTVIIGHHKEVIQELITKHAFPVTFVEQTEQRGTGHALLCSQPLWHAEHVLVMNGDMPLVNNDIIQTLIDQHMSAHAAITFVTAHNGDPSIKGYGRVVINQEKISIIEERNFIGDTTQHCCVNAGIYLIKRSFLEKIIPLLTPNELTHEIYITDLIKLASDAHERVETVSAPFDQIRGINTLRELWIAEQIKKSELINFWMSQGVRFLAPHNIHIDHDVTIGSDTVISAHVQLLSGTRIGKNCFVDAFSVLRQSTLHDQVIVHSHSVINQSTIHEKAQVGPFAHIRNHSSIGQEAVIGNFVEVTASTIGKKSKAKHLSYLGNSQVGASVNIGAGTITCNYNGIQKHTTTIQDNSFIGSNSSLVAPVTIGAGAIIGAGSVVTKDVPDDALSFTRPPQIIKEQYAPYLKERYRAEKAGSRIPASRVKKKEL